jgi:hypothetical protein
MNDENLEDQSPLNPQDLIENHFLGTLSNDESKRLEELLTNDPEMRKAFRRAAAVDSILRDEAQKQSAEPKTVVVSWKEKWKPALAAAAGLVVLMGLTVFLLKHQPEGQTPVLAQTSGNPVLAELSGPVTIVKPNQERITATPQAILEPNDLVEVGPKGYATIQFPEETTHLQLLAGGQAQFASGKKGKAITLNQGTLQAEVAKQPEGSPMTLVTPQAKVTVIGTRFRLDTDKERARLEVREGLVELEKRDESESVRVKAGQFVEARDGEPLVVRSLTSLDFGQRVIGVEQMAATINPAEAKVPDLTYGIPPETYVKRMETMGVSLVMIRVSKVDQQPLVKFVQELKENGGDSLAIILSDSLPHMEKTNRRKELAENLAKSFNALEKNGLGDLVKGCHLGENDLLNGQPSTSEQWEERFDQVLDVLTQLNDKTKEAFKERTILIHGEGGGANFKGISEAYGKADFDQLMKQRCANYAFAFELLDMGAPPQGVGASIEQWEAHLRNHCGLEEWTGLGKPLVFMGGVGGGLLPRSLEPGFQPEDGWNRKVLAIRNVFRESGWTHFIFGPMVGKSCKCELARPVLHHADGEKLQGQEPQLFDWNAWKRGVLAAE